MPDGRIGPAASEIIARLLPRLRDLGITRLGDITGLDRLSVPVIQAARPLSLSNSVAQGKGPTREAAALSAILETAECFFAERLDRFDRVSASATSLGLDPARFAFHLDPDCPPGWAVEELVWTEARDLLSGKRQKLPLALVHTAYVHPSAESESWFQASTSGLAVAFNSHDAVLHGLLECIERDALARAQRIHGFFQRCRIDPATIADPALAGLLDKMRGAGVLVGLWSAPPGALDVPVIWCHLLEEDSALGTLLPFPADGSAAGFDPARAAIRAIEEAAQSRLAAISGAREDITRLTYPRYPDWDMIAAHRKLLREGPRPIAFETLHREAGADWLDDLLARGGKAGLSSILVVDLDTAPFADLSAVKVLVPDLAPLVEG